MIYQRVLVPVSGKNSGERAAKALRHAKTLCSGEIILLHVTEALPNLVGGAAHTELERSNTAKAETLLAPLADALKKACGRQDLILLADALKKEGVACRYIVREGLAADTIVTVGHEEGVDMIVMYTDGRDGLADMLIGSITERVLRNTDIPLLAVRR